MADTPGNDTLDGDTPEGERAEWSAESAGSETLVGQDTEAADEIERDAGEAEPTHIARYVILRRVGEGGMGVVYAAYDNELDRRVAIKLVRPSRSGDSRARVKREAQAMARLSHPNVVQVYEVGEHGEQVYVAMEFVTGPTLSAWTRAQEPSPTRWRAILAKYIDVGRGLAAAHAARLVHRDFKPANAIVGDDGRVRVLDFGIARASVSNGTMEPANAIAAVRELDEAGHDHDQPSEHVDPLSTPLTRTGALVGTPAYMSPEQFEQRAVDARSDQFSFCVALYEALYGERPFAGDTTPQLLLKLLAGEIRPAPQKSSVPTWVREIVVRGLATEPEARWSSMTELLDRLGHDPELRRRRRVRTAVWSSLAVAAVLASIWFARVQMRAADEAERAAEQARELEAIAAARELQAQAERDQALRDAQAAALRARDTARVLAAQSLRNEPDIAAALLRDVEQPAATPGWRSAAVNALQRPITRELLSGHEDRITYLDLSLDNRWIASSSFDDTARLWPRAGGSAIVLDHHTDVLSAAFSRYSDKLVTGARDGTARVWTIPQPGEGQPLPQSLGDPIELRGHQEVLWSAVFSNDGNKVATASRDQTVRVWWLDRPEQPLVLQGAGIMWWAEFSPNERWVVGASSQGFARVWSLDDPARPPIDLIGHTAGVGDVHFAPTMDVIVTTSVDGSARLYHFSGDEQGPLEAYAVLDHQSDVVRARFSLDGMRLVTSSRDRSAKVWTLAKGGSVSGPPIVIEATGDAGVVWSSDFSPDGMLLAVGRGDGVVQVQPLRGGPPLTLRGHTSDVFRVRFSMDNTQLVTGSSDGTIRVWSTQFPNAARELDSHGDGRIIDMIQRGRILTTASTDGSVYVWPVEDPGLAPAVSEAPAVISGHAGLPVIALDAFPRLLASADDVHARIRLWRITGTWVLDRERPLIEIATPKPVRQLALDPAGEQLVAMLSDDSVWLWTLGEPGKQGKPGEPAPRGRSLAKYTRPSPFSTPPAFSPDGRVLATTVDAEISLWPLDSPDTDALEPVVLEGHSARVMAMSFSPDGRRLATASTDHTTRVWNVDAPEQAPVVLEHAYFVYAGAFDPAGERLLTGCGDTNAYLWTLADPSTPVVLSGAAGEIRDVAYSPDGRWIAAASTDGSVRVWSVDGGEPIELDAGHSLSELEFADNGRRLAAAGYGTAIWLWHLGDNLDIEHLQQRLHDATAVCLSPDHRVRFIGESLADATAASQACKVAAGR